MHDVKAIVGTAGHIDHGKTALVGALTGIDTDRLPEERERGISIELGFAHLDLDGIGRAGVVDVPGHERFIRQMLAGAHGFDLVLVVVAADDGVMPQTEEHFDIVHLLGVERAIFVITKIDAVSPERIAEVAGEIEILAAATPFESSPVAQVSARTGEGIDRLRALIAAELAGVEPKPEAGALRIPVDRVFVVKGHGVVATGTALSGTVSAGQDVLVLPGARTARVREIQVHGRSVSSASAGQRVALNLSGIDKEHILRGATVTTSGGPAATLRMDARIEVRPAAGRPLASHTRVRVHHGTSESPARLVWLDGVHEIAPRASGFAQLVLAQPLVAAAGDRFIVRDETATRTLGGGTVLLAHAEKHRRSHGAVAPMLEEIAHGGDAARLLTLLKMTAMFGLEPDTAADALGLAARDLPALVKSDARIVALPDPSAAQFLFDAERLESCLATLHAAVERFQHEHPEVAGMDLELLRGSAESIGAGRAFRLLVDVLAGRGEIERTKNLVHTRSHAPSLGGPDAAIAARVLDRIEKGGVMPPVLKDLADGLGVDASRVSKIAGVLVLQGVIVKVSSDLWFSVAALDGVRIRLEQHLTREGEITAAGFRDLIAASRKYCIPLLDWFDRSGVTIRVGDVRKLRRK